MAQRYSDPLALARMRAGKCPECGEPTSAHGGLGSGRCTLRDDGVAARIAQFQKDEGE